jgi:hypothetical protein
MICKLHAPSDFKPRFARHFQSPEREPPAAPSAFSLLICNRRKRGLVFEVREGTQKNFVFKTNFGAD